VNSHSFPPRPVPDRRPSCLARGPAGGAQSQIDSQALFKGATEIVIDHEGAKYRLRITRQGKLILNK
jgi:hemin uptake protein HemP